MFTPNHVIDRAGLTLRGALSTLEDFAKSFCQIQMKTKKSLTIWPLASTVPYGKSGPGDYITFIERLDKGLRWQLLGQTLSIFPGLGILIG